MAEKIDLLGTHAKQSYVEVQPCLLPLVVLFSIAAQENRFRGVQGRRPGYRFNAAPLMRNGYGPYGAGARTFVSRVPMQGTGVRIRGMY